MATRMRDEFDDKLAQKNLPKPYAKLFGTWLEGIDILQVADFLRDELQEYDYVLAGTLAHLCVWSKAESNWKQKYWVQVINFFSS